MSDEIRDYIMAEIADLERKRQALIDAAQAQINLLTALIEEKRALLGPPEETRPGAP